MRATKGLLLVVALIALSGCSSRSKPSARHAPPASPPTSGAAPTSSASTTTSALVSGPGYEAARSQWIGEALVGSSALQNTALSLAVMDLTTGETSDTGNRSRYPSVIAALKDFERLPITSVTPAQDAEGNADTALVNRFFAVSQPVACGPDQSASTGAAAVAWFTEPDNTTSGVVPGPLQTAASDLEATETADPAGTACYPAAIDDLRGLAGASQADIAASGEAGGNHADTTEGAEIGYLNEFFAMADPSASTSPLTEPCPSC